MSLYPENEVTASVYHTNDSDSTKVSSVSGTPAFTIKMFLIRRGEDALSVMGAEYGEYIANVNGEYSNSASFRQGDTVVADGVTYIVINRPRYNTTFDRYKLVLRRK